MPLVDQHNMRFTTTHVWIPRDETHVGVIENCGCDFGVLTFGSTQPCMQVFEERQLAEAAYWQTGQLKPYVPWPWSTPKSWWSTIDQRRWPKTQKGIFFSNGCTVAEFFSVSWALSIPQYYESFDQIAVGHCAAMLHQIFMAIRLSSPPTWYSWKGNSSKWFQTVFGKFVFQIVFGFHSLPPFAPLNQYNEIHHHILISYNYIFVYTASHHALRIHIIHTLLCSTTLF